MKINLFYVLIGGGVIVAGTTLYFAHAQHTQPPTAALTAIVETTAPASTATSTSTLASAATAKPMATITPASAATAAPASSGAAPTAPTGLSAISVATSSIVLSWGASYDPSGVAGYRVTMDKKDTGTTAAQKFEVNGLQASTTYSFTVAAYNQSGAYSKESAAITATTHGLSGTASSSASSTASTASSSTDTVAPSVPVGLFANAVSTSEIDLSWTPSSDNTAVTGYRIFSNGTFIATSSASSYKSTGLLSGATYSYTVAAYDAAGNLSAQTASISATTQNPASNNTGSNASTTTNNNTTTADTTAPTTSITAPAAGATVSGTITVTASASDNVGVTKVEFYADGTLKGSVTALPYTFSLNTTSLSDGTHSVTAKAYDAAGNVGTSPSVSITVKNSTTNTTTTTATSTTTGTVPGTPTGLSATAISSSEIDLAWSAPANASGLTGYQIFRNGHPLAISSSASYKDTGLTSATGYSYTVTAYSSTPDNAGPHSASVSATTPSAGN